MLRIICLIAFLGSCSLLKAQSETLTENNFILSIYSPIENNSSLHGMGMGLSIGNQYYFKGSSVGLSLSGQIMKSQVHTFPEILRSVPNSTEVVGQPTGSIFSANLFVGLFMNFQKDPKSIAFQPNIALGYGGALFFSRIDTQPNNGSNGIKSGELASNLLGQAGFNILIPLNEKIKILMGSQVQVTGHTFDIIQPDGISESLSYNNWSIYVGFSRRLD